MLNHPIPPVYDPQSKILILGSFPSVLSRDTGFFYGHPRNRFWTVTAAVCGCPVPRDNEEKKAFLLANRIALWDVIAGCEITGSADSSIRNVIPNDLSPILETADIAAIFTNGTTADRLYRRHLAPKYGRDARMLPSTSPANAAWSTERLIGEWKVIADYLQIITI